MAYQPRLNSNGMQQSKYWYSQLNPYFATGYGLPNCTCYAFGRFWEINNQYGYDNEIPRLPNANAEDWWNQTYNYEKGDQPKLGSIICFRNPSGLGAGHVAIVEEIHNDGEIVTSNSAWQSTYFYLSTLRPEEDGKYHIQGSQYPYVSQGFIYNPHVEGDEPVQKIERGFPWVLYANKLRNPF